MNTRAALVQIMALVLGAGALRFVIDLIDQRRKSKQMPAETDGIVAKGAESAVLSLKTALDAAERRIGSCETRIDEQVTALEQRDARIKHLEDLNETQAQRIAHLEELCDALRMRDEPREVRPTKPRKG